MLRGIDISSQQGEVNWDLIKNNVDFALIKVSEGVGYCDPQFQRNRIESRRVGILRGYYHEVFHDNSPEDEANSCVSFIDDLNGELLAFVWGDYPEPGIDVGQWCGRFIDQIRKKYVNYNPLFYSNLSTLENNLAEIWKDRNCGLWLADPDGTDVFPQTQWPAIAIKQYSWTGNVAGISGDIDLDYFNGDKETFLKYCYVKPIIIQSKPPTTPNKPTPVTYTQAYVDALNAKLKSDDNTIKQDKLDMYNLNQQVTDLTNQNNILKGATNDTIRYHISRILSIIFNKDVKKN